MLDNDLGAQMESFDDDVPEYMSNQPEQATDDENSRPWWDTDDAIAS
jgi:hypothetical protein